MSLRRFLRDSRGAAAAELALILPAIAFIFLNVADLGFYIFTKMQVDLAAHDAVGAARVLCDEDTKLPPTEANCPGLADAMDYAAESTSLDNGVTLTGTTYGYFCSKDDQTLATAAATDADCSAHVTGSTAKPGIYISTQANYTFTPIFPGASVASVLTTPITRTAWMRLQ